MIDSCARGIDCAQPEGMTNDLYWTMGSFPNSRNSNPQQLKRGIRTHRSPCPQHAPLLLVSTTKLCNPHRSNKQRLPAFIMVHDPDCSTQG
jgi:hypothetical protein